MSETMFCFFFQAEDGIRDLTVTGVQTCALPISGTGRMAAFAENCFRQKQPFVLCLSHIGSWEFCSRLFPHFAHGQRTATVYQRIRNPYIDRHIREARSRFGLDVFERSEGFGKAIKLLRSGGAIGVLIDQHAGASGLWTPCFGRLASTTPLPALLARRAHAKPIGFAVHTEGVAR